MVTSLGVNVGQLGWQKFDVTKVVSNWYQASGNSPKDKLTLLVDCTGCGSHVHISTFGSHSPHVIESTLNTKGIIFCNTQKYFKIIFFIFLELLLFFPLLLGTSKTPIVPNYIFNFFETFALHK